MDYSVALLSQSRDRNEQWINRAVMILTIIFTTLGSATDLAGSRLERVDEEDGTDIVERRGGR